MTTIPGPENWGWPATERRTPADECQSCLTHTDDPPRLPAADVLADAVAVLRELADGATPGHRSYVAYLPTCRVGKRPVATIYAEGDRALWAAFGPDEARLLADLLEVALIGNPTAVDLAYALTGHQPPGVSR
jgi:hypothetical protein